MKSNCNPAIYCAVLLVFASLLGCAKPPVPTPKPKRPVFELKQLVFADAKLKQQTELFHELAEGIAGSDWFVQRYKDVRFSARPRYEATWQTTQVVSSYYLKPVRPYRAMKIVLGGPDPKPGDGKEQLNSMTVSGSWVPLQGWAATVSYNSAGGWAWVGLAQEQDARFSFDSSSWPPVIRLNSINVSVAARESSAFRYEYQLQFRSDTAQQTAPKPYDRFFALFESPEKLRATVLADIDKLRRISRDEISRSANISLTDHTHVRSDSPPERIPVSKRLPTAQTKQELLDQVLSKLDSIEQTVKDNHQQMHAAINKALPLSELRDALANP